jgi:hypothetical protein
MESSNSLSSQAVELLINSIKGPLANRAKFQVFNAGKNRNLAASKPFRSLIVALFE